MLFIDVASSALPVLIEPAAGPGSVYGPCGAPQPSEPEPALAPELAVPLLAAPLLDTPLLAGALAAALEPLEAAPPDELDDALDVDVA